LLVARPERCWHSVGKCFCAMSELLFHQRAASRADDHARNRKSSARSGKKGPLHGIVPMKAKARKLTANIKAAEQEELAHCVRVSSK
jgi:hypothetical protein